MAAIHEPPDTVALFHKKKFLGRTGGALRAIRDKLARKPFRNMLTVHKLWLGFSLVFSITAVLAVIVTVKIDTLNDDLDHAIKVAQPLSTTAYEMKLNAISSGMGVLTYLRDPDPALVSRFQQDRQNFLALREIFASAAPTAEAVKIGERARETYQAYHSSGAALIAAKDRQIAALRHLEAAAGEVNAILNAKTPAPSRPADTGDLKQASLAQERLLSFKLRWAKVNYLAAPTFSEFAAHSRSELLQIIGQVLGQVRELMLAPPAAGSAEGDSALRNRLSDYASAASEFAEILLVAGKNLSAFVEQRRLLDEILNMEVEIISRSVLQGAEIGLQTSMAAAYGNSRTLQFWLVFFGGVLIAICFISLIVVNRSIVRPVRALMEGTSALRAGNLDYRIDTEATDELGQLSRDFNAMAFELREATQNLERQVRLRTIELNRANDALKEELVRRRSVEGQLLQAQKIESLGTLAGGFAHDFNNMLYVVLESIDFARESLPPGDSSRRHLDRAMAAGQRSEALVKKILSFSRQQPHDFHPVEFDALVRNAVTLLEGSLPSTVVLTTDIEGACGVVRGDGPALEQVIVNLIVNAYQALKAGKGSISVCACHRQIDPETTARYVGLEAGGHVGLKIRDTGIGIPPEILPLVFDPFFTTRGIREGTGLGLSVAHGVITDHGGIIRIVSEPGKGTMVEMLLPLVKEFSDDARSRRTPTEMRLALTAPSSRDPDTLIAE